MAGDLIRRDALERIIQRAAELQAGERDIGEGLTSGEVLALGKDVGIPERYLRQAMLEEQTRTAPDEAAKGTWAWLTGPRTLSAHRVVPGDRPSVERALARWMTEDELLQPRRRYADRTSWEAKAGAFASIQRVLSGRRYGLARADMVTAQVVELEPGFCLVRLEADVHSQRTGRISGGAALTVVGWGLTGAALLILPPLALAQSLALLPGIGMTMGGALAMRSHRGPNERIQVALEQVLDRLERNEMRTAGATLPDAHPILRIAEEVRKVFDNPKPKPRS